MKNALWAAVLLLLFLSVPGCGSNPRGDQAKADKPDSGETKTPRAKKLKIAVVPKGLSHQFWKSIHAGAAAAAVEQGNVDIYWDGPSAEDQRGEQIRIVQTFITKQVDGICLAPLDAEGLVAVVEQAKSQDIPTVIFDSGLANSDIIVSYVATNNYHGGQLAGQALSAALGGKGNAILLRYAEGSESTDQRERGFLDEIAKSPGIKLISSDQYAGPTDATALKKAQPIVEKYRDVVQGIFACNESSATGMLQAIENAKIDKQVKFVGFDPSPRMNKALADGAMDAIVLQDPYAMGHTAVTTMVKHLRGEKVEKKIGTGEFLATKKNMNDPEIKQRLEPKQFSQ